MQNEEVYLFHTIVVLDPGTFVVPSSWGYMRYISNVFQQITNARWTVMPGDIIKYFSQESTWVSCSPCVLGGRQCDTERAEVRVQPLSPLCSISGMCLLTASSQHPVVLCLQKNSWCTSSLPKPHFTHPHQKGARPPVWRQDWGSPPSLKACFLCPDRIIYSINKVCRLSAYYVLLWVLRTVSCSE